MFREATVAVRDWLETITISSKTLNVVYASPERAISDVSEVVGSSDKLTPFPIISFYRSSEPVLDIDFWTHNVGRKHTSVSDDGKSMTTLPRPLGYVISYDINLWSWYLDEMDCIEDAIIRRFNRDLYLRQNTSVGEILLRLELGGIIDNTDIEAGINPRVIRRTINLTSNTFMIRQPSTSKLVLDLNIDILKLEDSSTLDSSIVLLGNSYTMPIDIRPNTVSDFILSNEIR